MLLATVRVKLKLQALRRTSDAAQRRGWSSEFAVAIGANCYAGRGADMLGDPNRPLRHPQVWHGYNSPATRAAWLRIASKPHGRQFSPLKMLSFLT